MDVKLNNIGRRFNREWIFQGIDYTFESGNTYAILGHNGSGKSTLLQVIAGSLSPSSGSLAYLKDGKSFDSDSIYHHVSIAAPYMELIEEFNLRELLNFHFRFKQPLNQLTAKQILALTGLDKAASKPLKYFSSGMKQRIKLILALCSDTSLVLLDEPTSNLDQSGIFWYREIISQFAKDRTLIVCSNQDYEYEFCNFNMHITDYKRDK